MRESSIITKLRQGEVVSIEDLQLRMTEGEIKPGDVYVAERNTGPKLLTAREIGIGCIHPYDANSYSFDIWECVKVEAD